MNLGIRLSKKETEVLECLLAGLSIKETADSMGIVLSGVKNHRTSLYKRFNVRNDVGLVLYLWSIGYPAPTARQAPITAFQRPATGLPIGANGV